VALIGSTGEAKKNVNGGSLVTFLRRQAGNQDGDADRGVLTQAVQVVIGKN